MNRTHLRRGVIREVYGMDLVRQLFEQDEPELPGTAPAAEPTTDVPAAPTPPADTGATPPPGTITEPAATPAAPPVATGATPAPTPMPPSGTPASPSPPVVPSPSDSKKKATDLKVSDPVAHPVKAKINQALSTAMTAATKNESRRLSLRFLLEAEEAPKIDMDVYAGKIANLIKNFTSLVDVKQSVIKYAEELLDQEFPGKSDALKSDLQDKLALNKITLEKPEPPPDVYAVGAKSGGGAA